jgi:hypothetical protein
LREIVLRLRFLRLLLHGLKNGEGEADQNRNDDNNDEQLDEGEGAKERAGGIPW